MSDEEVKAVSRPERPDSNVRSTVITEMGLAVGELSERTMKKIMIHARRHSPPPTRLEMMEIISTYTASLTWAAVQIQAIRPEDRDKYAETLGTMMEENLKFLAEKNPWRVVG